jgi:hypothetical protein
MCAVVDGEGVGKLKGQENGVENREDADSGQVRPGNPGTPYRLLFDTGSRVYRICAWPDTQSGGPGDVVPTGGPQGPHHVTQRGTRPAAGRGDVPGAAGRNARP